MPYKLEEDIISAASAGFEGVELWWDKIKTYLQNNSLSQLRHLLEENKLAPIGICPLPVSPFRGRDEKREDFLFALEVAEAIGCELITICLDFKPVNMTTEDAVSVCAGEISWFSIRAAEKNIRLCVEPISRHTLVPGPKETLDIINKTENPGNLGVVMDFFHYSCSSVSVEDIKAIPVEKLFVVHANDSTLGMAEELRDSDRLYPGEGCLNLKGFIDCLTQMGYKGYFSVEVFRPEYWEEPIELICKKSFKSMLHLSDV